MPVFPPTDEQATRELKQEIRDLLDAHQTPKAKKVFIICPVRKVKPEVQAKIGAYVGMLESGGYQVHWPPRDTDQDDPVGMNISTQNGTALLAADEVHMWYDPESQGSVFDLGMLFSRVLSGKPPKFVLINKGEVSPTPHKSYTNVILALAQRLN